MTERDWDIEVLRLEDFFDSVTLPAGPIVVERFLTIHDPKTFAQICLRDAKSGNYSIWNEGNIVRLQMLEKHLLSSGS